MRGKRRWFLGSVILENAEFTTEFTKNDEKFPSDDEFRTYAIATWRAGEVSPSVTRVRARYYTRSDCGLCGFTPISRYLTWYYKKKTPPPPVETHSNDNVVRNFYTRRYTICHLCILCSPAYLFSIIRFDYYRYNYYVTPIGQSFFFFFPLYGRVLHENRLKPLSFSKENTRAHAPLSRPLFVRPRAHILAE